MLGGNFRGAKHRVRVSLVNGTLMSDTKSETKQGNGQVVKAKNTKQVPEEELFINNRLSEDALVSSRLLSFFGDT